MFNYNPNSTNNSIQLINNYTNCLAKTMYVEGCVCHSCTVTDLDIDHVGNVARLRSIASRASSNIQCLLRSYDQWSIGRVWTRVRLPATHSDTHTHTYTAPFISGYLNVATSRAPARVEFIHNTARPAHAQSAALCTSSFLVLSASLCLSLLEFRADQPQGGICR